MVHYVPASLDNITKVAEYVLNKSNRHEMKSIVNSSRQWCKRTNVREQLLKCAKLQLNKYEAAVHDSYNNSQWTDEWDRVWKRVSKNIGSDLVNCNV